LTNPERRPYSDRAETIVGRFATFEEETRDRAVARDESAATNEATADSAPPDSSSLAGAGSRSWVGPAASGAAQMIASEEMSSPTGPAPAP